MAPDLEAVPQQEAVFVPAGWSKQVLILVSVLLVAVLALVLLLASLRPGRMSLGRSYVEAVPAAPLALRSPIEGFFSGDTLPAGTPLAPGTVLGVIESQTHGEKLEAVRLRQRRFVLDLLLRDEEMPNLQLQEPRDELRREILQLARDLDLVAAERRLVEAQEKDRFIRCPCRGVLATDLPVPGRVEKNAEVARIIPEGSRMQLRVHAPLPQTLDFLRRGKIRAEFTAPDRRLTVPAIVDIRSLQAYSKQPLGSNPEAWATISATPVHDLPADFGLFMFGSVITPSPMDWAKGLFPGGSILPGRAEEGRHAPAAVPAGTDRRPSAARAVSRSAMTIPALWVHAKKLDVAFELSGKIKSLPVSAGQTVEEGELLAELDPEEIENLIRRHEQIYERAQSEIEAAKLNVSIADANWETNDKLFESGSLPHLDHKLLSLERDKARTLVLVAERTAGTAKAELENYRLLRRRHRLLAPCRGRVQELCAAEGEYAKVGEPVVRMIGGDSELHALVPSPPPDSPSPPQFALDASKPPLLEAAWTRCVPLAPGIWVLPLRVSGGLSAISGSEARIRVIFSHDETFAPWRDGLLDLGGMDAGL